MFYVIGSHYEKAFKVGSQFAWVDCTLCKPDPTEEVKGTWALIPSPRRLYDEAPGEELNVLNLLSCLATHTLWHANKGDLGEWEGRTAT